MSFGRWLVFLLVVLCGPCVAMAHDFEIRTANCAADKAFVAELRTRLTDDVRRTFHDILMSNELNGGCGALQLTDARMDSHTNGLSFGPSQFDLATGGNAHLQYLLEIIACAKPEPGTGLSPGDLALLKARGREATWTLRKDTAVWQRFLAMRDPIEKALASTCGREKLAASYMTEIASLEDASRPVWAAVKAQNAELADAEKFFRLYALDLTNVLGAPTGFRAAVAESTPVCFRLCGKGVVPPWLIAGPVAVSDFIRYPLQTTCYGFVPAQTRRHDTLRRLNRVLAEIDLARLPLTPKDRAYLVGEFADTIATNRQKFPQAEDDKLRALVTLANNGTAVAGTAKPLAPEIEARATAVCATNG